MTDWQPIETADRPKEDVMVAQIVGCTILQSVWAMWHESDLGGGWVMPMPVDHYRYPQPIGFEPTHWQPPPPPEEE